MADFNSNTGEGRVTQDAAASWATARGSASGTATDALVGVRAGNNPSGSFYCTRAFFPIDTSSIPDTATVTTAVLKLYRDDTIAAFANGGTTTLHIVTQTQASNTALATSDFSAVSFVSKGSLAMASTSNNTYNTITITDLSIISLTGHTKLAVINSLDLNNSAPGANTDNLIYFQSRTGTNKPTLTVTYTTGTASFLMNFV